MAHKIMLVASDQRSLLRHSIGQSPKEKSSNICTLTYTCWNKASFTFIRMTVLDVLLCATLPVYFLPCRGSRYEVSFSWSEPSLKQKGGVNGGRASCFVSTLSAMMQFIIKMQIEQQGASLHLVFTLIQHSSREAHLCPRSVWPSR